jgi:hypothetical protein
MTKIKLFLFLGIISIIATSCKTAIYVADPNPQIGVNFTEGKWLLNELDCPKSNREKITSEAIIFFKENLKEHFFYINDVRNLLITKNTPLNPSKTKLKELKDGTGYDYFINIVVKKNKSDLNAIGLYDTKYPSNGKNESEAFLEIYDLNLLQIIYTAHVIGTDTEDQPSAFDTKKSDKLIDNISFYKSSNKLMSGCLKKILKDLKKKSIKN